MEFLALIFAAVIGATVSRPTANNLLVEQPRLTMRELAQREDVHISTVWRWCLRGVRGHRLEYLLIGSRRYITGPSWERFVAATNDGSTVIGPTLAQREREIDRAVQELDQLGV